MLVSEYLNTSYRPDQELLDGQLSERNVGEYDHSNLQGALVAWMGRRQHEWNIRVLPAQRIRASATRVRIPGVCVVSRERELEPVFTRPPLICIEVLSKDDTLRGLQERVDDYRAFGVPNIWILDPSKRDSYVASDQVLEVANSPIRIPLTELFSDLD